MKTLAITLCMLLVILPTSAQQIAAARAPNFYVPYGVRDVPVNAPVMESSSDAMRAVEPPQRARMPPMRRPYPVRRRGNRHYGPGYGAALGAPATGVIIGVLFATGLACYAMVAGDQ